MQQQLTQETTVPVSIPPALPTQQSEQIPVPLETLSEVEVLRTDAEQEVIQSETLVTETSASQESATSIELILAKIQRQWKFCFGLNFALLMVVMQAIPFAILGFVSHRDHMQLLSDLQAHFHRSVSIYDPGIFFFIISFVMCVLMVVFGVLKIPAQSKFDVFTRTVAELDDTRAVGPLISALAIRHRKRHGLLQTSLSRLFPLQGDGKRPVNPLIEALFVGNWKLRTVVIASLTRLLPRMSAEDATQLSTLELQLLNLYERFPLYYAGG